MNSRIRTNSDTVSKNIFPEEIAFIDESVASSKLREWEVIARKIYGNDANSPLNKEEIEYIYSHYFDFQSARNEQVNEIWDFNGNEIREINTLVLRNIGFETGEDIGMLTFLASEEVATDIVKSAIRLDQYFKGYSPESLIKVQTPESKILVEVFEEEKLQIRSEAQQIVQIFSLPGSLFYLPDTLLKELVRSIDLRIRQFENSGSKIANEALIGLLSDPAKCKNELIRFGREKNKISTEHMEKILVQLLISPLKAKFDAIKSSFRSSLRDLSKSTKLPFPQENILPIRPIPKKNDSSEQQESVLKKILKIQARIQSISFRGAGVSSLERNKLALQIQAIEQKSLQITEILTVISKTKDLLNKLIDSRLIDRENAEKKSENMDILPNEKNTLEVFVPPEAYEEAQKIIGWIRSLRGDIGNPSSTCTTNKGSYGDGQFWFNYLSPLFNAIEAIVIEDPTFSLHFSWKKVAEHEKIHALYQRQKFRYWHSTLLGGEESSDILAEWKKLPELVVKQIGSGGFNKKIGQPLVILTEGLKSHFEKI